MALTGSRLQIWPCIPALKNVPLGAWSFASGWKAERVTIQTTVAPMVERNEKLYKWALANMSVNIARAISTLGWVTSDEMALYHAARDIVGNNDERVRHQVLSDWHTHQAKWTQPTDERS